MSALTTLSDELSAAVAAAGTSVVAVNAGRRFPSSGAHWRDGVIVTADHTLERDDDITITLPDGSEGTAALAGRDPTTDLAVLKIQTGKAPTAAIADPADVRIGHVVLALARSGEDGLAASMGVISVASGAWTTWRGGRVDRFIRPDLALYPGFSGGPLVDVRGRVVGINTSGLSRHWTVTLPATTVDRVTDALLAKGRIARGYLGIGLQPVHMPESAVRSLALKRGGGAIVVAVEAGSPADAAGLLIGDVLVGIDDGSVADVEDIHALLGPERIGSTVNVRLVRAGKLTTVGLKVGERPASDD